MTETGDPYTFEDVARFLYKGAPPNQKLANILGVGLGRWRITPTYR